MKSGLRPCRVAIFAGFLLVTAGLADASEFTKFLHQALGDQMGYAPNGTTLNYHANLARQGGPIESYIAMYGSDDFFFNQCQGNLGTYVTQLYLNLLHRAPTPGEVRYWATQFQRSSTNRAAMVRSFCEVNHVTQLPSIPSNWPTYQVPGTVQQIATELVAKINLFTGLVQRELGGSIYGRDVVARAASLLSVAEQYRQVLQSSGGTGEQLRIAADNVEKALLNVQAQYQRVPGASSQSQIVLQQIAQLTAAARSRSAVSGPPYRNYPNNPVVSQPIARPSYNRDYSRLLTSIRRYTYGLQNYANQSPFYNGLYRDLEGLSVQIESLQLMARQRQGRRALRQVMTSIVNQANRISHDMSRADMRVQQGWWNIQHDLNQTAESLGIRGSSLVQSSRPVIINQPTWNQFPYQVNASHPSARNDDVVGVADQLLTKIDGYVNSLRPVATPRSDALKLIGRIQDLRHALLSFRQLAASGSYGSRLQRSSDLLMTRYQQVSSYAVQAITRDANLNSPLLSQIGELVQRLRYVARGIRT